VGPPSDLVVGSLANISLFQSVCLLRTFLNSFSPDKYTADHLNQRAIIDIVTSSLKGNGSVYVVQVQHTQ